MSCNCGSNKTIKKKVSNKPQHMILEYVICDPCGRIRNERLTNTKTKTLVEKGYSARTIFISGELL